MDALDRYIQADRERRAKIMDYWLTARASGLTDDQIEAKLFPKSGRVDVAPRHEPTKEDR